MLGDGVPPRGSEIIRLHVGRQLQRRGIGKAFAQRVERPADGLPGQAYFSSKFLDDAPIDAVEGTLPAGNFERADAIIAGIDDRVDEIIGRAEAKPFGPLQEREILQVGVGVADDQVEDDQLEIAGKVDPRPGREAPDGFRRLFVGGVIFSVELPSARLGEDLSEVLEAQELASLAVEPLDEQCNAIEAAQLGDRGLGDLIGPQHFAAKLEREIFVLDKGWKIVAVELRDVRCRVVRPCRGVKSRLIPVGEELLLHSGDRPAGNGRGFLERVRFMKRLGRLVVRQANTDGPDAVGAEVEKDAEVVLVGGPAGPCLAATQPAFGPEMLEEWVQSSAPIMIADLGREGAGNGLGPPVVVDEAGVAAGLAEESRGLAFEGDGGGTVRDCRVP